MENAILLYQIEMQACYIALLNLSDPETARNLIHKNSLRHRIDEAWKFEVIQLGQTQFLPSQRTHALTYYYYTAGMGINRICQSLKVSQQKVYELLEEPPPSHPLTHVMEMVLQENPEIPDNLEWLMAQLNVLHGNVARPHRIPKRREFKR